MKHKFSLSESSSKKFKAAVLRESARRNRQLTQNEFFQLWVDQGCPLPQEALMPPETAEALSRLGKGVDSVSQLRQARADAAPNAALFAEALKESVSPGPQHVDPQPSQSQFPKAPPGEGLLRSSPEGAVLLRPSLNDPSHFFPSTPDAHST